MVHIKDNHPIILLFKVLIKRLIYYKMKTSIEFVKRQVIKNSENTWAVIDNSDRNNLAILVDSHAQLNNCNLTTQLAKEFGIFSI